MFLVIRNHGVCPIEGFTTLGISTARGDESAIGQFGSGAKHGVLTLMRMGINPVIYIDKTKVQFYSEAANLSNGFEYNKVFVKVGKTKARELSMALEYGAIDWDSIDMALREFVSNALDASGGDASKVTVKVSATVSAKEGCTTIGVPLTTEVQRFYNTLSTRFLQFAGDGKAKVGIIDKTEAGAARIYRKGVFVREVAGKTPSLFDYNLGDEVKIDEARNMDCWAAQSAAAKLVGESRPALETIFRSLSTSVNVWERDLGSNYYITRSAISYDNMWQTAWKAAHGEDTVIVGASGNHTIAQAAQAKGFRVVQICDDGWYEALLRAGIRSVYSVLDNVNDKGHQLFDPTPKTIKTLNKVWEWVETLGMTKGKAKPPVKCFRPMMEGGSEVQGYHKDGVIHIGIEYEGTTNLMVEEVAHYVTGASDCSRDFQDYAFRLAAAMMDM